MMDRIGYETTQTVHYFQIDGSRSMTPAALLSALQEMAISHSDSLGFSVQYNLTHHCFWSVVNWHLKLYRMPKYNETITLQTWSDKFARFQANRSFFLFDEKAVVELFVALGLLLILPAAIRLEAFEYLEKEQIALAYGVEGIVERQKQEYAPT